MCVWGRIGTRIEMIQQWLPFAGILFLFFLQTQGTDVTGPREYVDHKEDRGVFVVVLNGAMSNQQINRKVELLVARPYVQ